MKKLLFSIALITVFSCGEQTSSSKDESNLNDLKTYEEKKSEEQNTMQFVKDYTDFLNTKDWRSKLGEYLPSDSEAFLEQHTAFRESFPNYKSTIKHMAVDGNEVILAELYYASTYHL